MEQRESADILREIIRMFGLEYLKQEDYFVNAFYDLGGTAQDIQLLRYLVAIKGHLELLNAGDLPNVRQQLCYSQTVRKLCEKWLISEELAHNVCGSFWRAVYNTEPPIAYKSAPTPDPAPAHLPEPESPDEIYARALEYDRKGNINEAVRLYRQAAELGHTGAQCNFGRCLLNGEGIPKDATQAVNWFRKSAAQGNASAQSSLGYSYAKGYGVPQSYFEAVKWYRTAAEQGNPYAQYNLSIRYENGEGVPADLGQAVAWCREAAAQGLEDAKKRLPTLEAKLAEASKPESSDEIYARALEYDRKGNINEAVRLYRQAAELGHAEAQCDFGCCLLNGDGVTKDPAQAVNWFRKSAAQGYARAQNWFGVCYAKGNGIPQNYFEAVKWYRLAAEQKDPYAQNNLSIRYEDGEGVPRDLEQAVAWCRKAAEQGHEEAKKRLPALEAKLAAERKTSEPDLSTERSTGERWLLTLGWLIISVYSLSSCVYVVVACFRGAFLYMIGGPLILGTYYILPAARRQYCLLNQTVENWQPKKRLWRGLFEMWTAFGEIAAFTMSIAGPIMMLLVPDFAEMKNNPWWYFLMGFPLYTIYYICSFIWRHRRKKKA